MYFEELPLDVLLHIFRFLSVRDIFTLRRTSKSLDAVSRQHSVWLYTLLEDFKLKKIPLLGFNEEELFGLSSSQLEHLAVRALRLRINWHAPSPTHTRRLDIAAHRFPTPDSRARIISVHFLNGRQLLATTMYDGPAGLRKFNTTCWDVSDDHPRIVSTIDYSTITRLLVNKVPTSALKWALTQPISAGAAESTTSFYTILPRDASPLAQDSAFTLVKSLANGSGHPLLLSGSTFMVYGLDHITRLINIESEIVEYELLPPLENDTPAFLEQNPNFLGAVLKNSCAMLFTGRSIHLYMLPSRADVHPTAALRLRPAASRQWQFNIDSLVVSPRPDPAHSTRMHAEPIDILLRFDTYYPWPINILHHFILVPNPDFSAGDIAGTVPYLHTPPLLAGAIPSPIRLFSQNDMVLGRRGTALWLDAVTHDSAPSVAADFGQRIAGKALACTPAPATAQADESTGVGGRHAFAQLQASIPESTPTTFLLRPGGDRWSKVAVDDEQGLVAVGCDDGSISVYDYAPP